MISVREIPEPGSYDRFEDGLMLPIPTLERNGIVLEPRDGKNVIHLRARGLEITVGGKNVGRVQDADIDVYITDARVAVACTKYDKGGGWSGGLISSAVLNAGSKMLAAGRRRGKMLVGQVRYPWLKFVGSTSRLGMFTEESLSLRVQAPQGLMTMRIKLDKHEDAAGLTAQIAGRAGAYRLASESGYEDKVREKFEWLTEVKRIEPDPANKQNLRGYDFPCAHVMGTESARLASGQRRLAVRTAPPAPAPAETKVALASETETVPAAGLGPQPAGPSVPSAPNKTPASDRPAFCKFCGKPAPIGHAFCAKCGAGLSTAGRSDRGPSLAATDGHGGPPPAGMAATPCSYCGARVMTSAASFCRKCGQPVRAISAASMSETVASPPTTPVPRPFPLRSTRRAKYLVACAAVVVIAIVVGLAVGGVFQRSASHPAPFSPTEAINGTASDEALVAAIRAGWPEVEQIFLPAALPSGWRLSGPGDPVLSDTEHGNPSFSYVPMAQPDQVWSYVVQYTNGQEVPALSAGWWPASGMSRDFHDQAAGASPVDITLEGNPWGNFTYRDSQSGQPLHQVLYVEGDMFGFVEIDYQSAATKKTAEAIARSIVHVQGDTTTEVTQSPTPITEQEIKGLAAPVLGTPAADVEVWAYENYGEWSVGGVTDVEGSEGRRIDLGAVFRWTGGAWALFWLQAYTTTSDGFVEWEDPNTLGSQGVPQQVIDWLNLDM